MKKRKVRKMKDTKSKAEELKEQLVRALADYDNLRKRVELEKDKFLQYANKGLIARFLTIYDMLENTQAHINDSGVAIILEEFKRILQDERVEQIEAEVGDKFNEELFEAVDAIETDDKKKVGKVKEVALSGWKFLDGPVIRPAKVKVYRKREEK